MRAKITPSICTNGKKSLLTILNASGAQKNLHEMLLIAIFRRFLPHSSESKLLTIVIITTWCALFASSNVLSRYPANYSIKSNFV